MSENINQPKRFSLVGHEWLGDILEEKPDGEYVLHSDYAALAAENERLRKAGDEVALHYAERIEIEAGETAKTLMRTLPVLKAWNAAKKGSDAK